MPPAWSQVFATPEIRRRFGDLKDALRGAGTEVEFDVTLGEFAVWGTGSDRRAIDSGRLCLSFLKSGRPKLASVVRVLLKRVSNEGTE
jgi:hypothetical protein